MLTATRLASSSIRKLFANRSKRSFGLDLEGAAVCPPALLCKLPKTRRIVEVWRGYWELVFARWCGLYLGEELRLLGSIKTNRTHLSGSPAAQREMTALTQRRSSNTVVAAETRAPAGEHTPQREPGCVAGPVYLIFESDANGDSSEAAALSAFARCKASINPRLAASSCHSPNDNQNK
jgi:hypothetical protein